MASSRAGVLVVALAAAALLAGAPARSRSRPVPPLCPAGRYLPAADAVPPTAIVAGEAAVALEGLCDTVAPRKFKATRRGTRVKAVWPACPGIEARVRLSAMVDAECERLTGRVKARRLNRRIEATRSRCGDGRVDAGAAEACDPPAAGACDARCRPDVTAAIGAAGGRVVSLDGLFTLDVPPGALPADTEVTVRRLARSELPEHLAALDVAVAYDLTPEGLQFAAPVMATLRLDAPPAAPGGGVEADVGLLVLSDAAGTAIEPLGDQTLLLDGPGGAVVARGTLSHFSSAAFAFRNPVTGNVVAHVSALPSRSVVLVGQPFTVDVIFELLDLRGGRTAVSHRDETLRTGAVRYTGDPVVPIGDATPSEPRVRRTLGGYSCVAFGSGAYRGRVTAGGLPTSVQLVAGIDCVQALPSTTTTTRPSTSTTRPLTATTRPSTSTSTSTSMSSTSSSTSSTSTTSTSSTTTTITGCCECGQGCASGVTVTEQRCESGNTICNPGPGVFVPVAFCDQSGSGNCVRLVTTTSSTTSTTGRSTTTTTRPPNACALDPGTRRCTGTCPTGLCLALPNGSCGCVTPGAACGNGGPLCPSPDQGCDPTGLCRPRQPCGLVSGRNDFPVCFGECPSGQICAADRDGCTCVPFSRVCQPMTGGLCGGLCPSPLKSCVPVTLPGGTRGCTCVEDD